MSADDATTPFDCTERRREIPADWPNAQASQCIRVAGLNIHYQRAGTGPVLLLLHGTGSSAHSWRDLLPLLATSYTVIAPDLPGHGFTDMPAPGAYSPGHISALMAQLVTQLDLNVAIVTGHSAGAVVACQMVLDQHIHPFGLIALNPALLPPFGLQMPIFRLLARSCAESRWLPTVLAARAKSGATVPGILRGVGSNLNPDGVSLYSQLLSRPGHVQGALRLMAEWNLEALIPRLKQLDTRTLIISGKLDTAVPPRVINRLRQHLPNAEYFELSNGGHLLHEEVPALIVSMIRQRFDNQVGAEEDEHATPC